jgi:5-methylcytosine-specific restriction endonuclease McrA
MWEERSKKRILGIREKQILYQKANHKCQACGKEIDFTEIQVGHKTAWSKGGSTTLRNSVCLCYRCNKLQGTDSWQVFMKKLGKEPEAEKPKTEKPKKKESKVWRCRECGFRLGSDELTARQLSHRYPDGCPKCGGTQADKK